MHPPRLSDQFGCFLLASLVLLASTVPVSASRPAETNATIGFSTLLGSSGNEWITALAVDANGFVYATGLVWSDDFPSTHRITAGGVAFVAKFKPDGSGVSYASVFGGVHPRAITVDAAGHAYITGYSYGSIFPATNAWQAAWNGGQPDAVLLKLSPVGDRFLFATYFGGADGGDCANAIALDASGSIWIAGFTDSKEFPVRNPFQPVLNGERNAFLAKFSNDGSQLEYSSYFGGIDGRTLASALAIDSSGRPVIAGRTSTALSTSANALQSTNRGGSDAFITRFNASGTSVDYSTLLGGTSADGAGAIALDAAGNIFVRGSTSSSDFPLFNAARSEHTTEGNEIFLAKISPDGAQLLYSTYWGSWGNDNYDAWPFLWVDDSALDIGGLAVDAAGNAAIVGTSSSDQFPVMHALKARNDAYRQDATVIAFNPQGQIRFSTYLGGRGSEIGTAVAVSRTGEIYAAGATAPGFRYPEFPTSSGAFQTERSNNGGGIDGFLTQVLSNSPAPTNDTPTKALMLTGNRGTQQGRITLAASYPTDPLHPNGKTLWWRWQSPITGKLKLSTDFSDFDTVLGLFQAGNSAASLLATNDNVAPGATYSELRQEVTAGQVYLFGVSGASDATGNFYLSWVVTAALNDDFADRLTLTGSSVQAEGSNVNTTGEDAESMSGRTVWWKWTPPQSGVYTLSTQGSAIETAAAIFTGTPGNDFKQLFGVDPVESRRAEITWLATAGQEYQIVIDGASGVMGAIRLAISPTVNRPTNDDFATPLVLEGRNAVSVVSDRYATSEPGDFDFAADPWFVLYSRGSTLWWQWTAPVDMIRTLIATNDTGQFVTNGAVRISTIGSHRTGAPAIPHSVRLAVLTGDRLDTLRPVAVATASAENGGVAAVLLQNVQPGNRYFITADKVSWEPSGDVHLSITVVAPPEFVKSTVRFESGRLRALVRGVRGSTYQVFSSVDLRNWLPQGLHHVSEGEFEFEDTSPGSPAKYFRVLEQ